MGMNSAAYAEQLQALLPTGAAWPRDPAATLTHLLEGFGDALARIDARADQLLEEADPSTTAELLGDWERVAGLPDACVGGGQSTTQRRAAVAGKLAALGGQSPAYYIAVAAALGYTITITEFVPHDVNADVEMPLCGDTWRYAWQVNAAINAVIALTVNDTVIDPLAAWGNQALECLITRLKPAHTHVIFSYT